MADAVIRSKYPGTDPNELTMPQYWSLHEYLIDLWEMENGVTDHRAKAERLARRRDREYGC